MEGPDTDSAVERAEFMIGSIAIRFLLDGPRRAGVVSIFVAIEAVMGRRGVTPLW